MDRLEYIRVVDTYANNIYRVALNYCRNRSDAEDVVQNVFLKLFETDTTFRDEEHIKRWLIRVTINKAKDLCSSVWKKRIVPIDAHDSMSYQQFATAESSDLYDAVMRLSDKYRIIIHLYYYEDYAVKEIAEILGIKETTIQTRLMRARKKLKMELKEVWQDE